MVASVVHYTREISGSVQFNQPNLGVGERAKFYTLISQYDLGDLTGAVSLNLANSNQMKGRLTGNAVFSVSPAPVGPCDLTLFLRQDAVGGRSIDWTALNPNWVGSGTPALPTSANAKFIVSLKYDGTDWWGAISYIGAAYGPVIRDGGDDYVKPYTNGWGLRLYGASSGSTALKPSSAGVLDIANASNAGDGVNLTLTETTLGHSGIKFRAAGGVDAVHLRAELTDGGLNTSGALTIFTRKSIADGSALTQCAYFNKDQLIGLGNDATNAVGHQAVVNVYDTRTTKVPLNVRAPFGSTVDMFQVGYGGYYFRINSDGHICPGTYTNLYFENGRPISWNVTPATFNGNCYIYGDGINNDFVVVAARKMLVNGLSKGLAIINGSGNNLGIGTDSFETNHYNEICLGGGTTPTQNLPFGGIHIYASQIGGNDWAPHFRCYGGNVIKLFKGLKANYNNFATLADIVQLLQNIGIAET